MLRVTVQGRAAGVPLVVLGSGETLLFGRSPQDALPMGDVFQELRSTALTLPLCAPHVSRVVGELVVGEEVVRLRWRGKPEGQLASLFDAPAGARLVTLREGMTAVLDEGENHLLVLRGRQASSATYTDLRLELDIQYSQSEAAQPEELRPEPPAASGHDRDSAPTMRAPRLQPDSKEWYVALALAEPWLVGADPFLRPPSNREIYERVLAWNNGYAWNLSRPQRVDDAIRLIAHLGFSDDDPFAKPTTGRAMNLRYAVGRRASEVLVTAEDLQRVNHAAARRP